MYVGVGVRVTVEWSALDKKRKEKKSEVFYQ